MSAAPTRGIACARLLEGFALGLEALLALRAPRESLLEYLLGGPGLVELGVQIPRLLGFEPLALDFPQAGLSQLPEQRLRILVTLIARELEPVHALLRIFFHSDAVQGQHAQHVLGFG